MTRPTELPTRPVASLKRKFFDVPVAARRRIHGWKGFHPWREGFVFFLSGVKRVAIVFEETIDELPRPLRHTIQNVRHDATGTTKPTVLLFVNVRPVSDIWNESCEPARYEWSMRDNRAAHHVRGACVLRSVGIFSFLDRVQHCLHERFIISGRDRPHSW